MNEDMILPEGFQEQAPAQPEAVESIETNEHQLDSVEDIPAEQQTQVETENIEQTTEQPKIRVKYNHEEKELTLEEATLLAQKGMNYDKTIERLKALETDPRLSFVEAQAKKYNMTPSEYIEAVRQQEEQAQINELIQKNIPEEFAREMVENRRFREQQQRAQQEQQAESEKRAKEDAEFSDFLKNFPEVKPEEIPKEVLEYRKETGKSLSEAMMWHENRELKNQLKVLKQNENNRKKAPVSGVTVFGGTETAQEDPFLQGFNAF